MVVDDARAAHRELAARGVEVGEIQELDRGTFVFFADPDDNRGAVQAPARPRPAERVRSAHPSPSAWPATSYIGQPGWGELRRTRPAAWGMLTP